MEITIDLPKEFANALTKKAAESGQDVKTIVERIVETNLMSEINGDVEDRNDFEADMLSFADETESIPPYKGTYSREEIYFDHD